MTIKVGINGFGRIGRLALRKIQNIEGVEVVQINDLVDPKMLYHLFKYDTTQGRFDGDVELLEDGLKVNGKKIIISAQAKPEEIGWDKTGVDVVLEATGFFASKEKAELHIKGGAKKVVITAPGGSDVKTIVYNINHEILDGSETVISAGSCTTNCLAPMANFVNKEFGIKLGTMTTIHAYTGDQMILDGPHRKGDLRRARAAALNIVPNSTGAAKAIGLVLPELQGKLLGHAQRVPVGTGSITELVSVVNKETTADEVNKLVQKYATESFAIESEEIVSSDIIGSNFGSIFDTTQTEVNTVDGVTYVKSVAWYDNESSYTAQLIRTLAYFASLIK